VVELVGNKVLRTTKAANPTARFVRMIKYKTLSLVIRLRRIYKECLNMTLLI
jgi:hypothetical protein